MPFMHKSTNPKCIHSKKPLTLTHQTHIFYGPNHPRTRHQATRDQSYSPKPARTILTNQPYAVWSSLLGLAFGNPIKGLNFLHILAFVSWLKTDAFLVALPNIAFSLLLGNVIDSSLKIKKEKRKIKALIRYYFSCITKANFLKVWQ